MLLFTSRTYESSGKVHPKEREVEELILGSKAMG